MARTLEDIDYYKSIVAVLLVEIGYWYPKLSKQRGELDDFLSMSAEASSALRPDEGAEGCVGADGTRTRNVCRVVPSGAGNPLN